MEPIELRKLIRETIAAFSQDRVGQKPPISLLLKNDIGAVVWPNRKLNGFIRMFLYETLLTNEPAQRIEILLSRRAQLRDLEKFVGVYPSSWLQLRVCGQGVRHVDTFVDELFKSAGYDCEEWVGVKDSESRLGIFAERAHPKVKIILYLESKRLKRTFSLLLPVFEPLALPCPVWNGAK